MNDKLQYRLSKNQKVDIATNLIDILQKDIMITKHTKTFIGNWLLTGHDEKRKAFYDVWDIVLRNYSPKKRPILFRSCARKSKHGKIVSFTGRIECARRFSDNKGLLIICDTKEALQFEKKYYNPGEYVHTFFPLVDVLLKARASGGWGFSERLLSFIGEDEYIMRFNLGHIHSLRWT
ncbi:hypothetical protein [Pedobacter cryoconitis]|uniref:hypothetical protein n=1 Tax=Pedobacter cryoconitis TaxID=188932 RepID=UPI0017C9399E|nr:hypothetical protein [Pedobacter cryoconitis]MBB5645736.1 hypothetical protein [Pedobacter cryoconitis]